ncbi:biotin-dependent carboxyltransferase family protein [Agreia bicolorata]|uniref:5-oxoprolinase subunit C family protein n=1 Tax=Agreia bicolorata TaxID=110935 RepID=UPI0005C9C0AF|nr:biotin-dependent carboxyltransferase family protein [Agreia bicolorata]
MTDTAHLDVTDTGWLTTFQDLGRTDTERRGVPSGGAADQHSAAVANILVGNRRGAPLIESMGGELAIVPDVDVLVAVTGTPSRVTVGGAHVDSWTPVVVPAGHELRISEGGLGARSYLAINGLLAVERFLGSAAPDARMGFGQVIARGSEIRVDTGFHGFDRTFFDQSLFRFPVPRLAFDEKPWTIDVLPSDQLVGIPGMRELVAESIYTVTDRSNHVGLRLNGPVLHPDDRTEIVSHGVPIGALEVPHADELIVLGRYRSLTAGYPIIGFATRTSLAMLGQAGPGRELRFRWVDRDRAVHAARAVEGELQKLESVVSDAFVALGVPTTFSRGLDCARII